MSETSHDYCWKLVLTVPQCHKWFTGVRLDDSSGIAVCDYSGETPDRTDDGSLWLDTANVVLINDADCYQYCEYHNYSEARADSFKYCHVLNLKAFRDDGEIVSVGGTRGNEIFDLVNHFGIKAAFIDYRGRTTRILPKF